jgi:hypothetical protein
LPQQETFLDQPTPRGRIEVLKTYDRTYAREAFSEMDDAALHSLWKALEIDEDFTVEADVLLWDELVEQSREDQSSFSFFVVNEITDRGTKSLYVSPDWPSAEAFASRLGLAPMTPRRDYDPTLGQPEP